MCGHEDPLFMLSWPFAKDPLFTHSWPFARPPFQHFQFSRGYVHPPNHKFLDIFSSKASKLAKSSVSKRQIGPKFSSQATFCKEIQFTRVPNLAVVPSQAPMFFPLGRTLTPKWNVSGPLLVCVVTIDIEYNKRLDRQRPCLEGDFSGGSNNIVQSNKSVWRRW